MAQVLARVPERLYDAAKRMYCLGRFIENSARTTLHVKQWFLCKSRLGVNAENGRSIWAGGGQDTAKSNAEPAAQGAERTEIIREMQAIASRELENARQTIPLVEYDSRLGYEPSMEYMCDRAHLEWKIQVTENALRELC